MRGTYYFKLKPGWFGLEKLITFLEGRVTASTELKSTVEGQRWRGAIRHVNVEATKNGKVLAFPARPAMAFAAAA